MAGAAEAEAPKVDIKDVASTDFMKDLVNDLGLDIDAADVEQMNQPAAGEEEKKDEEGKNNKDGGGDGAAGNK